MGYYVALLLTTTLLYVYDTLHTLTQTDMTKDQEKGNAALPRVSKSLAPYCCPICNGNGLVPNGFYTQTGGRWITCSITPETCRSCNGTGIVWG
jgi:hypothetical protein